MARGWTWRWLPGARLRPPSLQDLLFTLSRRDPLTAVAKLRTHRAGIRVQPHDTPIADVLIDRTRILSARRVVGHVNEIDVELREETLRAAAGERYGG